MTEETLVPLGRDHPEIRDAVRAICDKYPGAYWRELEASGDYPDDFVKDMTEAGFLSALIPEEYGGSGLPLRAGAVILEEIHASGCDAYACHAQMYMMHMLVRHGSQEQRDKYLPGIASGEIRFQAFGVTEPTTGSDTLKLKTKAVRDGDHYVVSGQKIWTSRARHSDLMTLLVRTTPIDQVEKKTDGLSVLLVDINESLGKGLTIKPIDTMVNHHTNEVFYDNLRVPAENLIGEEGKGFRYILSGMNAERILVASESLGDARYFVEKASAYAGERTVFGKPIGANQGVQFPIAQAYSEWKAADMVCRSAAALFEAGQPCGEEANIAKHLACESAWHAGEACMQTFGGFAAAREYDIERKWRSARLARIAPISTNLILSYIGQHVLGMAKSY
ncbi:acyl-CoA dehydrogenase family protein [Psychromarinibacter halotolerans]|uniref:Acyl-CoA dehydrogenase family protein n=1 Tax=Psychromarinibacter halotolerans TaxID=1775175 RepID=A0ABV7GTM2_9RHOB|nr:acyl-CoA dehydrogenase family protein [Psychromarinibacter halotolerans]MDF0596604.1 acyl-CoA/acyl-ACP dehydrogenase [Psychromarinibacter halotolerans]